MVLQGTCAQFPVPGWQLTTIPNLGFTGSDTLFWLPHSLGTHVTHTHTRKQVLVRIKQISQFLHVVYSALDSPLVFATMSWLCSGALLALTEETRAKASSQVKNSWWLTGSRSREATVLSQYRLPGEGYRPEGKGGPGAVGRAFAGRG